MDNFFLSNELNIENSKEKTFHEYLCSLTEQQVEELGVPIEIIEDNFNEFLNQMLRFLGEDNQLKSLTILSGYDKNGKKESFDKLILKPSDVVSIVGPTGSGKSRLLADIEWIARADTPTGRKILINDEEIPTEKRFSGNEKLVAQLSQNMNFVMDLTVREYIELHAKSRLVDPEDKMDLIIKDANNLSGEGFDLDTYITSLSGGQSRALMISDTANLSSSPIVLIDEIENAGIDRKSAIELLMRRDKIVIMATHDPMLALMADKRIVIKNGGIDKIIESTEDERQILRKLSEIDNFVNDLRNKLRHGEKLY
ncbi:ATP-binding cassette domain-containing protein [Peptoniphilus sp. oral taxon 386]|nr:ATP-binding cassette domain-containing protein [Peptoniphilus sp. oral taxon 386]